MKSILGKYWFSLGIVLVVMLAFRFPEFGILLDRWNVLKTGVFLSFLIAGLTLETRKIFVQIKNFKGIAMALISCFVFFPVVTHVLAKLFIQDIQNNYVGLCLFSLAPVSMASGTILTRLSRGNTSLSLLINVTTQFLSIFIVPFSLSLLLRFEQPVNLSVLSMIWSLTLLVLVPVIGGQIIRLKVKDQIGSWKLFFSLFCKVVLFLIIFHAIAKSIAKLALLGSEIVSVLIFLFSLYLLVRVLNFGIAKLLRFDGPSTSAFTIQTSQKSLAFSFILWYGFLTDFQLGLIFAIIYYIIQSVLDPYLAQYFAHVEDTAKKRNIDLQEGIDSCEY